MNGGEIVGVSASLLTDDWEWPLRGLRHRPRNGTSGWYIWTGELSDADDFFKPLHASHLVERCPKIKRCLDLPPGSRFLITPSHEGIWSDESLLAV